MGQPRIISLKSSVAKDKSGVENVAKWLDLFRGKIEQKEILKGALGPETQGVWDSFLFSKIQGM